jgi:hypothetical protein
MSGTTVHVGADDGLLETAARASSARVDGDLVLVVPEGAPVLANPLFLETIRDLTQRPIVLVTADLRGRRIASGLRMPAFASLGAYEQRMVDATEELERRRLDAIAQIGRERRRRRASRIRTAVAIVLAAFLMLAFLPSAEVTVAGEESSIGPYELDVNGTVSGLHSVTLLNARLSPSIDAAATGSRVERSRATGTERFSNVSTDPITIPAGTLVWTTSNVAFRTTQAKSIPASTFFPFFVNEAQIPIEAVDEGAKGNVARGEIRNVADRRLRVTNDAPTAGGDEKTTALVSAGDFSAASVKLDQAIDRAINVQLAQWGAAVPDGRRLEDHYATKTISRTAATDVVGKDGASFHLAAIVDLTGYLVPANEPQASAVRELSSHIPAEHEVVPESLHIEIPSVRFTSDGLIWHVLVSGAHRRRVDQGALQLALAGQDRSAAAKLLEPLGMKLVGLQAFPSWWPRLPFLPLRIDVRDASGA